MKFTWIIIYPVLFTATLLISLILTPLADRLGRKLSLLDRPQQGKIHNETKSRSGGVAIFASFMLVFFVGLCLAYIAYRSSLFHDDVSKFIANIPFVAHKILWLLIGSAVIFAAGVVDDRITMRPWTKLFWQIVSSLALLMAGIRIHLFLPSWLGAMLTVFWVVLLTNSFNFMDNMDGLSSGIAAIVSLVLGSVAWREHDVFVTALLFVLAGAVLGFWYFNFIKSRLFMGDAGSLFIGYMIAALTAQTTYYKPGVPTGLPVLTPLIILGVPLFDTISVLWIRYREGRPLMKGDTNHFSHRLVFLGMTHKQAVIFIYLVTLCVALCSLPLAYLPFAPALVFAAQVICWFLIIYLLERTGKRKIKEGNNK
ncbi:MAG TPA: MraY family glycosyltransferase [Candidatus Sumerlaeota bacterium]|nr:MAG: putative undecaprenyl-phosphate N-acetylglucosaminyl 1-phosphate transferase [candidate division BRC1 bacterium ADurb.Bin183]HOE63054.1 MraY family glycosyltransferase [Candidatus Sumerlaeota bacterium]HRR32271.1 MraY family glycosyltransferase [Candidatus Sumerlaeia bacterium]HON51436.1 MraY family glycosyltransferase [Candidatus Sumerlaeota bacterium]HOR65356.1 MraY family glycosyltransferase [Candidatus Sumerlaeota bacterium]